MATKTSHAPYFFDTAALPTLHPLPDVPVLTAQMVAGDRLHALFGHVEPNGSLPLHSHPHDQITYVIAGAIHFAVGDEAHDLTPGKGLVIPGGVTHGGTQAGPEGCHFIEIFTPLRENYLEIMRQAGQIE